MSRLVGKNYSSIPASLLSLYFSGGIAMYIRREVHPSVIWFFSRKAVFFFTILSVLVYVAYARLKITFIAIPFLPVATIGTAVAFYVGFKNNASYERLWEARKIWAEIEHLCRMWALVVTGLSLPAEASPALSQDERKILIYRQLAWVNALRIMLRNKHPFQDEEIGSSQQVRLVAHKGGPTDIRTEASAEFAGFLSADEIETISKNPNTAFAILDMQVKALSGLKSRGLASQSSDKLYDLLKDCSQQQCACERLNNFPFPRQYAHFSSLFVNIFIVLLPFSLLSELKADPANLWLVIPFSILISWVFFTMEKVGDSSENPFENGINDVPLSSICRDIEIQLRSALHEEDLPSPLAATDFVLM
jgi:ion channel-forming bestrophin family protein